jgi:hypothetical protein
MSSLDLESNKGTHETIYGVQITGIKHSFKHCVLGINEAGSFKPI